MTSETKELIKEISIIEVAEKLGIKVVRKKMALCYSGHDKTPSLSFDAKQGLFYCFGCGLKGDQISLVKDLLGLTFSDACLWIIQEFNIYIDSKIEFKPYKSKFKLKQLPEKTESLHQSNPEIYEWLINRLSLSRNGLDYLMQKRGFSKELIEKLEIKDIPNPNIIFEELKKTWGEEALINSGLCRLDEKNYLRNLWWDHVIVFPFTDLNYRINYLQGRRLYANERKYLNLFHIKPDVYNINTLTQLKPGDNLYICEGVPDTITAMHMNYNAIGVLGANNFDIEIVKLLINYNIGVIPDSDTGGKVFVTNVKKAFRSKGKTVQEYKLPTPFNDLNELFTTKNSRL